jgi:hypothetical protein
VQDPNISEVLPPPHIQEHERLMIFFLLQQEGLNPREKRLQRYQSRSRNSEEIRSKTISNYRRITIINYKLVTIITRHVCQRIRNKVSFTLLFLDEFNLSYNVFKKNKGLVSTIWRPNIKY